MPHTHTHTEHISAKKNKYEPGHHYHHNKQQQRRGRPANLPRKEVRQLHAEEIHYNSGCYWVDNWTRLSINGFLFTGVVDNFIPGPVWRSLVTMDSVWGRWWHIFFFRFLFYHLYLSTGVLETIKKGIIHHCQRKNCAKSE